MKTTSAEIRMDRDDLHSMVELYLDHRNHPFAMSGRLADASVSIEHRPGDQREPDEWVVKLMWFGGTEDGLGGNK